MATNTIDAELNSYSITSLPEVSLISVFKSIGLFLPRFCFHNNLSVAGNCRACLLEVVSVEKPVASCVTDLERNFQVWSESPFALKARENVLEILLSNHPLDCPICDQAGECDLQDQAKSFGNAFSRFFLEKRGVVDKACGSVIKTIMTRCIHCTRCIRFTDLIEGPKFGILNRGSSSEIGLYNEKNKETKLLGNVVDLCPVGALTSRSYAFKGRPWELSLLVSLDPTDALGSSIYAGIKGTSVLRLSPKPNKYINGNIISDRCRYSLNQVKSQRLNLLYEFCTSKKTYSPISWFRLLTKKTIKARTGTVDFLLSPEISLNTLVYLKHLSNYFYDRLAVYAVESLVTQENYYFYALNNLSVLDEEQDVQSCLLFSSRPEDELTLLGFKLKLRYQQGLFMLFSMGFLFHSSLTVNFLSAAIKSTFSLLEAKRKRAAHFLFSQAAALVIFGYSFLQGCRNHLSVFSFLKGKLNGLLSLKLNKFANDESLLFVNVQTYFRTLETSVSLQCLNLYENLALVKDILPGAQEIFWFGTQKPVTPVNININFLVPTFTFFEDSSLFVSFENRFQGVHKIFATLTNGRALKHILSSIYFFTIKDFDTLFAYYVSERLYDFKSAVDHNIVFLNGTTACFYPDFLSSYLLQKA